MRCILAPCLGLFVGAMLCLSAAWAQELSNAEVEQALDMQLRVALEEVGNGMQVITLAHRSRLKVPDGFVSWKFDTDVANLEPGRQNLPIVVLVNGRLAARSTIRVSLKQRVLTPMLRHNVKRGHMVGKGDLELRELELSRALTGRIKEFHEVVGLVAKKNLRKGRPLVEKWFELPLAVDRGDRVRVKLLRGGLKIETVGVALQRGWIGDMISIRNPKSRLAYEARITAPGEARVQAW